jgi:hypothetical protein
VAAISRAGTEYRADPNRTHDSLSTLRLAGLPPICGRRAGSAPSRSRSACRRSAGTAQISLCVPALTSAHHAAAAVFAAAKSLTCGSAGTTRSRLA